MTVKDANFPTSVWDGLTRHRPDRMNNKAPDHEDWDEMTAELLAVMTHLYPVNSDAAIWVAPHGKSTGTGSIVNPFATLALGLAAITSAKKTICLMPGTHTITASVVIPVTQNGIKIVGIGGSSAVIIDDTSGDDQAMSWTPAAAAARVLTIEGVEILQYAAKKGLLIDDTGQTVAGITVNLKDVKLTMDSSGSSLDMTHAVDVGALINITDCVFTGLTDLDVASTSDVFKVRDSILATLNTSATDKVMAINATNSQMTAITGGHTSQVVNALHCTSNDVTLFGAADVTGSQTGTNCKPVSA